MEQFALPGPGLIGIESSMLKYSASWWTQLQVLCSRSFRNQYRDPMNTAARFLQTVVIGTFIALVYLDVQNPRNGGPVAVFQARS
jgi:hypothetical protein